MLQLQWADLKKLRSIIVYLSLVIISVLNMILLSSIVPHEITTNLHLSDILTSNLQFVYASLHSLEVSPTWVYLETWQPL